MLSRKARQKIITCNFIISLILFIFIYSQRPRTDKIKNSRQADHIYNSSFYKKRLHEFVIGQQGDSKQQYYNFFILSNNEFPTTLTLLNAIAPPAIIGLNNQPVNVYKIPAAIGMPRTL